jgi:signal transduction histidine kinase
MNFSDPSVIIASDEKLLRNIFSNLLSNAIKFSPGKKEVHLLLRRDTTFVEVVIRDHGIGISPEDLQRVFEPYTRGTNATSIKGTGLGLSIVKKAAETLGGTLAVKSEIGSGTEITLRLNTLPIA